MEFGGRLSFDIWSEIVYKARIGIFALEKSKVA